MRRPATSATEPIDLLVGPGPEVLVQERGGGLAAAGADGDRERAGPGRLHCFDDGRRTLGGGDTHRLSLRTAAAAATGRRAQVQGGCLVHAHRLCQAGTGDTGPARPPRHTAHRSTGAARVTRPSRPPRAPDDALLAAIVVRGGERRRAGGSVRRHITERPGGAQQGRSTSPQQGVRRRHRRREQRVRHRAVPCRGAQPGQLRVLAVRPPHRARHGPSGNRQPERHPLAVRLLPARQPHPGSRHGPEHAAAGAQRPLRARRAARSARARSRSSSRRRCGASAAPTSRRTTSSSCRPRTTPASTSSTSGPTRSRSRQAINRGATRRHAGRFDELAPRGDVTQYTRFVVAARELPAGALAVAVRPER